MTSQIVSSPMSQQDISPENFSVEYLPYSMPGALATLATSGAWRYARHLAYIEDRLLDLLSGRERRIMLSIPPQHGKSTLVSQYFTAFYLGRFPRRHIILASYESTFAMGWGRRSRDILERYGPSVFGVNVSTATRAANHWETTEGGSMTTAGAGGSITGRPSHFFIIDDPIKNQVEALSQSRQEVIEEWYKTTVYTRQAPDAAIFIIMTRWSDNDLIGRLLDAQQHGGDQWTYINLPAIAIEGEEDPLGRSPGEALWPERYPVEWLEQRRRVQGEFWFNAMYQGRPTPRAGYVVNASWFRRYATRPDRSKVDMVVLSFDTAQKDKEINDYTVCTVWYIVGNAYYLVDVIRDRYKHPRLLELANNLCALWRPNIVLIEDKASGTSLLQHLEDVAPVLGIDPTGAGNKVVRMQVESPAIEAGQVWIPQDGSAPWLYDFLSEVRSFPASANKDQVDSLSQFLRWAREQRIGVDMW